MNKQQLNILLEQLTEYMNKIGVKDFYMEENSGVYTFNVVLKDNTGVRYINIKDKLFIEQCYFYE